jgi:hypothetical protein
MFEVGCLSESFDIPIKVLEPLVDNRVIGADSPKIAFEVVYIDYIKPNDGGVCAYINLSKLLSKNIRTSILMDQLLKLVECGKDSWYIIVVFLLGGCEPSFVDTAVEIALHPHVDLINGTSEILWVEIQVLVL